MHAIRLVFIVPADSAYRIFSGRASQRVGAAALKAFFLRLEIVTCTDYCLLHEK